MFDSTHSSESAAPPAYALNREIARDMGIVSVGDGQVPTQNGRGIQMAETNPLFGQWLSAFDGVFPLLDIGAAYGVNTLAAVQGGADVVALDCDETHLEYIRRAATAEAQPEDGALSTVYGKLPELDLPQGLRASAILCSEVVHFLTGDEVEESFRRFSEALIPEGLLCLTCCDSSALYLDEVYWERRELGHRWPGELTQAEFDEFKERVQRELSLPEECFPTYLHVFEPEKIFEVARNAGFRVVSCGAQMHGGYPEAIRGNKGRPNIQLVAIKS